MIMMRMQSRYAQPARASAERRNTSAAEAVGNAAGKNDPSRSLAMVYGEYQRFEDLYDPGDALYEGTLFRQLNKPFHKGFRI